MVGGLCLSNIFLNFQYFSGKYEKFDFYKAQILRLYIRPQYITACGCKPIFYLFLLYYCKKKIDFSINMNTVLVIYSRPEFLTVHAKSIWREITQVEAHVIVCFQLLNIVCYPHSFSIVHTFLKLGRPILTVWQLTRDFYFGIKNDSHA